MGERQLLFVRHLTKRARARPGGLKDGIVAEALLPARRPHNQTKRTSPSKVSTLPSGCAKRQRAHNERAHAGVGAGGAELRPTRALHRNARSPSLVPPSALNRHAGITVDRENFEPGIVRQCWQARRQRRRARLESAALPVKVVSVSSGSGRPSSPADTGSTARVGPSKRRDLAHFSRIMRSNDQSASQTRHGRNTCLTRGGTVYIVYQ